MESGSLDVKMATFNLKTLIRDTAKSYMKEANKVSISTSSSLVTSPRVAEQGQPYENQRDSQVRGEHRCDDRVPVVALLLILLDPHCHRLLLW